MQQLEKIARWIRYQILVSTTAAGSGHPTTSLSATDLMTALFFNNHFRFLIDDPKNDVNDRLIFSKGHASPLFYALWSAAGAVKQEDLLTLRKFDSVLEGHPTPRFAYTEASTGSLGQGLSVGVGMSLNAKYLDKLDYKTYVLLGDGEMMEGQVWEAAAIATHYKLDNLVAIVDVNRLGQSGETIHGWHTEVYENKLKAFGWEIMVIDGHNLQEIDVAYNKAATIKDKPFAIIAKTIKGKGISFLENKEGHHGVPLKKDELELALKELGDIDMAVRGKLQVPTVTPAVTSSLQGKSDNTSYDVGTLIATRKAYGIALKNLGAINSYVVALDGETKNSTFAETFMTAFPDRFFEMYIAEQNMVSVALGLSLRGKIPFVSTFAAFFTRAFDQIRMAQYSNGNVKFVGSHAGVSIGEDGPSQMGLEDLSLFSSIHDSVVLYPSEAVSTEKLMMLAANNHGIVYIRTTRKDTPVLYSNDEIFEIGKSKTIKSSKKDVVTIVAAGVTLFEALKAYEILLKENITTRVIDAYSIKPIDTKTLQKACDETKAIITVEDHYEQGGIGSAVAVALSSYANKKSIHIMAVTKTPRSGTPDELLAYEEINAEAIVKKVKEIV